MTEKSTSKLTACKTNPHMMEASTSEDAACKTNPHMMVALTTTEDAAHIHLGLSKKDVKSLAVKINDWYAVGIQLGVDDYDEDFLDKLVDKLYPPTKCCIEMLKKWNEMLKVGVADQVETLIRALKQMNGKEDDAIQFLTGLLPKHTLIQTIEDTDGNQAQELSVEGRSSINSIVGQKKQVVSVSGNSRVGNVAVNPVAHTFVQMTTPHLTEEEKEEKLQKVIEERGEELLKELEQSLQRQYYRDNFTQFTPDQYSACNKIDMNDLFTDMIMFQTPHLGNEKKAKEISIDNIAMPYKKKKDGDNNPNRILIQGELGNGKTTLMKRLSRSWADDPSKGVFSEKLVLFIELKNMQKEKGFLDNVIENGLPSDILHRLGTTLPVLRRLIVKKDQKFVFLCDGYDELLADMGNEIVNVFERKELNESVMVVTTRPDNMDKLVKVCESHIKIRGFKPERQDEYINKFFNETSVKAEGEKLIRLRDDRKYNHIFEMARTPLFLFYLCTLWKINGQVPSTVIELYRELLVCKVNQFLGKQQQRKIDSFSEISKEHLEAMLYVGEATLNGLFENRLNIKETELNNENQRQVASKLGLIFEETSVSELRHMKSFTTTHKSESEFLASMYVAESIRKRLPESNIDRTARQMLGTSELAQVCKFTVALLGADARRFMDYFPLEDFKSSALADLLVECPDGEVAIVKDSIKQRMDEVKDVTIKSPSGLNIVKELNNFTNAVTCTLDTTSGMSGGSIPNVISSMNALTSLTWDGITDDVLQTFSTSESLKPSFTNLSKVSLQGKVSKANACSKLGSFLNNMKAMTSLRLPVISYGPGLYAFVNAMSGHHPCSGGSSCNNISPSVFKNMKKLTFVLKRTFSKEQRNSGYAHLVSEIMALCPSLEKVNTQETNDEFESSLFKKLTQMRAFRNRQTPDVNKFRHFQFHTSITFPTNNKNCVSILFVKGTSSSRSTSGTLSLIVMDHGVDSKLEFRNCRHMSMPVQLLSQYPDIDVSESVHLTWYPYLILKRRRNDEEVELSQIMTKHKHLDSLSLPCESLANQLPLDEEWKVTHVEFTCNDTNQGQGQCQKYLTRIISYLSHIKSIQTLTLHPFEDAVSHLEKQIPAGFSQELLNKLLFSCPQKHDAAVDKDPLIQLMGQLPKPWLNQMDVDREGNISFALRTKCEHEGDGSKHTVTSVKDDLQRKINCTMISFGFNLRGLTPCRVQQLLNKLRKERICIDKLFIFPGLVFSNPLALQIISGLKEVKEVKLVSFDFDARTMNNYQTELHMVRKKTLKVFDLTSKQLMSCMNVASGTAMTEQCHPSAFDGGKTSQVRLNIIDNKKVTKLSEVLRTHPQLSDLRIVDYFDGSSQTIENLLRSCDKHTSLKSLTFQSKLLNGSQAITMLECFPNLQQLHLSALQNVEHFFNAVVNRTNLARLLLEVDLGDCDLHFQHSGSLIAKFLMCLRFLKVFKVLPTDSKVSASTFIEFLRHINTRMDSIHGHLRELSFGELKVDKVDSNEVGEMCGRLLFQFPHLQSFDMSMFRTGKSTLTSFFTTLTGHDRDQTNVGLRHLDLSGHILKSDEIKLFVKALEMLPNVSELRLEKCRIRGNPGNLLDKICHFSKFDLSSSHFKAANHKKIFIAQILRFATTETKLVLVETKECFLTSLGGELRSTGIVSSLGYLNLSNSKLSNVELLKDFLVTFLPKLKTLVLKKCGLNATVLGKLVTELKSSSSFSSALATLDMSSSKFCKSNSGRYLVSVLELFPELLILRLSDCKITNAVMEQFLKYLKRGKLELKLRSLVLLDNDIKSADKIALQVAAHLPLDCKVKLTNSDKSVGISSRSMVSDDSSSSIVDHDYNRDSDDDLDILDHDYNRDSDDYLNILDHDYNRDSDDYLDILDHDYNSDSDMY